jgi:serine/threonine-protein kinase RsbW
MAESWVNTNDQMGSAVRTAVSWRWTHQPQCVRLVRAQLRKTLAGWGLGALEDSAVLVISELFTNAVRHAPQLPDEMIQTRFVRENGGVRLEVYDTSGSWPVPRSPGESGGFGLLVVEELADCWGVEVAGWGGKAVWALVTRPGEGE